MAIKIGQLYSFRVNPNKSDLIFTGKNRAQAIKANDMVMEVVNIDGYVRVGHVEIDGYVGIIPLKDRSGYFKLGAEYIAAQPDIIHSGYYQLIWDPYEVKLAEEYGIECMACRQYYPHAIKVDNFRCWSCRNGF